MVETPEEAKERAAQGLPDPDPIIDDDELVITQLIAKFRDCGIASDSLTPTDFDSDDDSNFHIDFIHACSNLRARNYRIPECDRNKTLMYAGKISPVIASTITFITGVVSNEIYKFTQGFTDVTKFKSAFCNLALPSIIFSQPEDVIKNMSKEFDPIMCGPITCLPEGYTNYDRIDLNLGSLTFKNFFDWLVDSKGVEIAMVLCGEVHLYNAYLPGNKHAPRLEQRIEDVYRIVSKKPIP